MDGTSLELLAEYGIRDRFPEECKRWNQRKIDAHNVYEADVKKEATQIEQRLQAKFPLLERVLREAIIDAIIRPFPYATLSLFRCAVDNFGLSQSTHIRDILLSPSPPQSDGDDGLPGAGGKGKTCRNLKEAVN